MKSAAFFRNASDRNRHRARRGFIKSKKGVAESHVRRSKHDPGGLTQPHYIACPLIGIWATESGLEKGEPETTKNRLPRITSGIMGTCGIRPNYRTTRPIRKCENKRARWPKSEIATTDTPHVSRFSCTARHSFNFRIRASFPISGPGSWI